VPKSSSLIRACAAALVCGGVVVLSGCAVSTGNPNEARGEVLFVQTCGSCHVLTAAGTGGTQGPDLDAAFAESRANGMDSDTIEGVVAEQIANPRPSVETNPLISMPADIVTGEDAEDVAAYVARVAGVPGVAPPPFELPDYFVKNCGSCHVLADAATSGTIGPDLDEVLPGQSMADIEASIVEPSAEISPGYQDLMPASFGQSLQPDQLTELVEYLVSAVGGGPGE
jgi:mono/diheme cytochrome c family protein